MVVANCLQLLLRKKNQDRKISKLHKNNEKVNERIVKGGDERKFEVEIQRDSPRKGKS